MKKPFALLLALSLSLCINAQVKIVVVDEQNQGLIGALIEVNPIRSEGPLKQFLTDVEGVSLIPALTEPISVKIGFIGYQDTVFRTGPRSAQLTFRVQLKPKKNLLKEVNVEAQAVAQELKGDTTVMNAAAFTTNPDASTADLLNKMPGIDISNGKIQAQGEDVAKVFVDGKPFFGEDSKAALDLIPADMVDAVKVYDRQSDQSRFTGFNDGKTSKTLDIITKKEKRFGVFGSLMAGVGDQERYQADGNINLFRNQERITFTGSFDNVNGQAFGMRRFFRFGMMQAPTGIRDSWSGGINYSNVFRKNLEVQASYNYSGNELITSSSSWRSFLLPQDSGQTYQENDKGWSSGHDHSFNAEIKYQLDSNNSLEFRPRVSVNNSRSTGYSIAETFQGNELLNFNERDNQNVSDGLNYSANLLYKLKLKKVGRTLSTNLLYANNENESQNFLNALSLFGSRADTINQKTESQVIIPNYSGSFIYTEPLSNKSMLEFRYEYRNNREDRKNNTFSQYNVDINSVLDSILSSQYDGLIKTNEGSVGYNYSSEKFIFNSRIGYGLQNLSNVQFLPRASTQNRDFLAWLPFASVEFKPRNDLRFRLEYSGSNQIPGFSQLQEVVNNSNPLQLSSGNPDLRQSYSHEVETRININDARNNNGWFFYNGFTITQDFIGQSTQISSTSNPIPGLEPGVQFRKPENLEGFWSWSSFMNYGFPLFEGKIKGNIRMGLRFNQTPSIINDERNLAQNFAPGGGFTLGSNLKNGLDITYNFRLAPNWIVNSLNEAANNQFTSMNNNIEFKYQSKNGFLFESNLEQSSFYGLSSGFNQNFAVLNLGVGYKFLKDKSLEAKLFVFDLLGQNNSVSRNFSAFFTEDIRQMVLERYVMFSITYRIKKFKGPPPSDLMRGGGMPFGRGMGGGRP